MRVYQHTIELPSSGGTSRCGIGYSPEGRGVALHVQHNGDSVASCSVVFQGCSYLLQPGPYGYSLELPNFSVKVAIYGKELRSYLAVSEAGDRAWGAGTISPQGAGGGGEYFPQVIAPLANGGTVSGTTPRKFDFYIPHSTAHTEVRAVLYGGGGGGFDRHHEELLLLCGTTD